MPPLSGEERLVTVFTDVHYYFSQPVRKPLLHRFDKASYFYIYHDPRTRNSRLEIANNPNTPDQDAFSGTLDTVHVQHSHNFPTLITLTVDGRTGSMTSAERSAKPKDPEEWRLASADPRDPGKNKYRLHTLDAYFWTEQDAKQVVDLFKEMLDPSQLDIPEIKEPEHEAHGEHHEGVSSVVQNLEDVAISDPAYSQGRTRNSQGQWHAAATIPGPPPAQPVEKSSSPAMGQSHANFAPMAYNPAAPPAPEPIAHREDTPPPEDDGHGIGLAAAAKHELGHPTSHSPQAGSSSLQPGGYGHYGSPPPASYGSPSPAAYGSPSPANYGSPSPAAYGSGNPHPGSSTPFAPPPPSASTGSNPYQHSTAAETYTPHRDPDAPQQPVMTPGSQFYTSVNQGGHKPLAHIQPEYPDYLTAQGHQLPQGSHSAPPVGGYSSYSYNQGQPQQGRENPYDVHSQVYRPTEEEAQSHHRKPSKSSKKDPKKSRIDSTLDNVDQGVSRFFKKIEKKIG